MRECKLDLTIASSGFDGCHIVVATLGVEEIHRDGLRLDRADDRDRFIDALVKKVPSITDDAEVSPDDIDTQLIALASEAPLPINWEQPEPIRQAELPAFPVDALPTVLSNWVAEESEATQTPPDMAALLVLAVCAATLAKRIVVEAWCGWSEPCNLFIAVILDPANRKSAVFADATRPLRTVEEKLIDDTSSQVAEDLSLYRQKEKRLVKLEKTAAESENATTREEASREARELAGELATFTKPEEPRLVVDDATSEKLAMMMQANEGRIASMSAEGGVFDLMAGKYANSATDMNIYLMGHSGDRLSVDRVTRDSVVIDAPALTVALAIQPEVIRGIAGTPAFRGRGLLGRFLYAIPKSWIGKRRIATLPVSDVATQAYSQVIESLARLQPNEDGKPQRIKLSDDAVVVFRSFCESIETELGTGALESMTDWGGKLAGATLRLAGILHCSDNVGEAGLDHEISTKTIEAAQRIAKWAIPHAAGALDLLSASEGEAREDAEYLLRWLKTARSTELTFARRDAQRHGHRRFNGQPLRLDAALDLLESKGYIANLNEPRVGGRVTYAVSPYVSGDKPKHETPNVGDNGDNRAPEPALNHSLSPLSPGLKDSGNEIEVTI